MPSDPRRVRIESLPYACRHHFRPKTHNKYGSLVGLGGQADQSSLELNTRPGKVVPRTPLIEKVYSRQTSQAAIQTKLRTSLAETTASIIGHGPRPTLSHRDTEKDVSTHARIHGGLGPDTCLRASHMKSGTNQLSRQKASTLWQ